MTEAAKQFPARVNGQAGPRRPTRRARPALRDDRHTHARDSGGRLTNTRAVTQVPRNTGHPQDPLDRWIEWARRPASPRAPPTPHPHTSRCDRRRPRQRPLQGLVNTTPRSDCSPASRRLPAPTTRRPRHARPRSTPTPLPANMTHGNDRRAPYLPVRWRDSHATLIESLVLAKLGFTHLAFPSPSLSPYSRRRFMAAAPAERCTPRRGRQTHPIRCTCPGAYRPVSQS